MDQRVGDVTSVDVVWTSENVPIGACPTQDIEALVEQLGERIELRFRSVILAGIKAPRPVLAWIERRRDRIAPASALTPAKAVGTRRRRVDAIRRGSGFGHGTRR